MYINKSLEKAIRVQKKYQNWKGDATMFLKWHKATMKLKKIEKQNKHHESR